jgi:3-hydroxy acid dehydrogenase/malonic semialdehyde reductase
MLQRYMPDKVSKLRIMNPIAYITGASSGIGLETARVLAKQGYHLILNARRKHKLEEVKKELEANGTKVHCAVFDVRDYEACKASVEQLPPGFKEVDVLVNNAGLAMGMSPIQDGEISHWETMIDTNIKGLLYMTRTIGKAMTLRGKGHIINIASVAGKEPYPNGNVYCATKFAVDALSRCMRIDMLPFGIKVTNIAPGMAETEFSLVRYQGDAQKASGVYQGITPLSGKDIAEIIGFAVSRPAHVNISDIVITPAAQAGARDIIRHA